MSRRSGLLALAALAALAAACGRHGAAPAPAPAPAPAAPAAAESGAAVYQRRCGACHGADARGDGPVAPTLRMAPPDLTRLAAGNRGVFPRARVIAVVSGEMPIAAHGSREMPVWSLRFEPSSGATAAGALWSARQLELLLSHLESIQRPASAASAAGSSADSR